MRISFRTKLLASHVGLVAAVVLLVFAQLSIALASDLGRQVEQRLEQQARGAAGWIGPGRHPERLAGRLSQVVHAGVAIVDEKGALLADSEDEDLVEREPNALANLPEIAEAREGRVGHATRPSSALGEDVHFVAVPGEKGLVVRLSVPLADIHETQRGMLNRLAFASLVGVITALGLGFLAARNASKPLRAMTEVATRIKQGDYDVEVPSPSPDEFGLLATTLATLASELKAKIGDLTAERDRVKKLETMRRDFVANASHELRTPVTAIQGYAETLLGGSADEATRKRFLEIIHRHARRLGSLLESLLRLSELEAHAPADQTLEPVRVGSIAAQVVETVRARRGGGTTMALDFADDAIAVGDPLAIEQVLENLVENAVKYGRDGGRIEVSGRREGDRVVMTVRDDGPGVEKKHLDRLFERFYRVDPSRSRERGGSGLGLAIVKHLVESMEGTVAVDSELGKGCVFSVDLPAARQPTNAE